MSKKTQKIDSGQDPEARLKRAKEVLEMHPTRDKVYFTADGEAFIEPQYANMHAATKPDPSVVAVTRDEVFPAASDPGTSNPSQALPEMGWDIPGDPDKLTSNPE